MTRSAVVNARLADAPRGPRQGRLEALVVPVEVIVNRGGVGGQRPEQVVKQDERVGVVGAAG